MVNNTQSNSALGTGCLALFSLPFAAVGVGMTVWLGMSVFTWLRAFTWVETPARIVNAELKVHRGKGRSYEVAAEYQYSFGGRQYTGHRVGIVGGADNLGPFQQRAYRELHERQQTGRPFHCYVNAADPSQALLYRDLRWELLAIQSLFAITFGGVGFGLLIGSLLARGKQRSDAELVAANPEAPWKWKADWAQGQIMSSSRKTVYVALVAAAVWNLVTLPFWFILPREIFVHGNRWALIGAVFPLIGVWLAAWALVAVLRWLKFGQSVLQMADVPGVIGGKLAGVVRTSSKIRPEDGFTLALRCVRRITTGSGKSRTTTEKVLWEDEQIAAHELLGEQDEQSAIPVLFEIPYSCRSSDESNSDDQTIWRLSVAAEVPGINYAASFVVPVFKTAQSDPAFRPDETATAEFVARPAPERELREAGVFKTQSPDGDGQRFIFPMLRTLGIAIALAIITAVFGGAVALTLHLPAPLFFPIGFGIVDALLLLGLLDVLFYRSTVDVSPRGLTVRGGLLGIGPARHIEVADVTSWETRQGWSSNQSEYYNLTAVCRNGMRVTLAKRLPGTRLASAVLRQMEEAAGSLSPPKVEA